MLGIGQPELDRIACLMTASGTHAPTAAEVR